MSEDFWGDAVFECWRSGGDPDRLDRDRMDEAQSSGIDGYEWGLQEADSQRHQRDERRAAEEAEEQQEYERQMYEQSQQRESSD